MTSFAHVADMPLRHWFEASQANVGAAGYSRIGSILTVSIETRHYPFFFLGVLSQFFFSTVAKGSESDSGDPAV